MVLAGCVGAPIEPVNSYRELDYLNIVRQQYDFSCGAASVATLVNGLFGESYTELDLLKIVRAQYDEAAWEQKREVGLTFDDLRFMANEIGYEAEGAAIGVAGLLEVNGPIIIHLDKGTFQHFSVLRGVENGSFLLADPITGQTIYSPAEFSAQYTGYAMALWKPGAELPAEYFLKTSEADLTRELEHARGQAGARAEPLQNRY